MSKHVLDVGNCAMDHSSLQRLLESRFDARLSQVDSSDEALDALRGGGVDLLLVNRRFDLDGADGLDLIRSVKADPKLRDTPVMLLSNYPEYQEQAEQAGALPGFGKAALDAEETVDRLRAVLGESRW